MVQVTKERVFCPHPAMAGPCHCYLRGRRAIPSRAHEAILGPRPNSTCLHISGSIIKVCRAQYAEIRARDFV